MSILNDIFQKALAMEQPQRAELAHRLLLSLESTEREPGWEEAWREEIDKRLASIDRGEVELSDWDETLARLRQSLKNGSST